MKSKKLTLEECKKGHQELWTALARGEIKEKEEFKFPDIGEDWEAHAHCFLCYWSSIECGEDIKSSCDYCPGKWPQINNRNWKDVAPCNNSLFGTWLEARDEGKWEKARAIAEQIAELPWKEK